MTVDEVKKMLYSYKTANTQVYITKRMYERRRERLPEPLRATDYCKPFVRGGSKESIEEQIAIAAEELHLDKYRAAYEKACEDMFRIEDEFAKAIECLNDTEKEILIARFMDCKPARIVAQEMNYSDQGLYNKYHKIYHKIARNRKVVRTG